MSSLDVRLIGIVDPRSIGRGWLDAARAAVAGGATVLQLRMKDAPAGRVFRAVERLIDAVDVPVYVNDRADIAWAAGAAGVHLGADDLPPARVRAAAPPTFGIGISVGTPEEAAAARDAVVDYWSLGAVFATKSKADAGVPIGASGFRRLAQLAPAGTPLVAIGGITAPRVPDVVRAGANGIAVIRSLFDQPSVETAARALRKAVDRARAARGG